MKKLFSKYVNILIEGEMDIHRGYMGRFEISQQEIDNTSRSLDNLSYTSYMIRIAYEGREAEILAAILSCAYSYEVIAQNILKNNPDAIYHPFYGDWIKGYTDAQYSKANKLLIDTLDKLTQHYTTQQIQHLIEIFVFCSRYELVAWGMKG